MDIKHTVSSNFIVEAVETFFNMRVKNCPDWVGQASQSLKEKLFDMVEECGVGENSTPSSIVDNFLINGNFVSREDDEQQWGGDVEVTDCDGSPLDNELIEETKQEIWEKYCQENALIYNDEFACLSF